MQADIRDGCNSGSRKNIEEHYDAGNAMYATFLDDTMTYSAGIHTKEQGGDLKAAQLAKLDAVIAAADLKPEDHVLEIGCGWGSFAIRAASTVGCRWGVRSMVNLVRVSRVELTLMPPSGVKSVILARYSNRHISFLVT